MFIATIICCLNFSLKQLTLCEPAIYCLLFILFTIYHFQQELSFGKVVDLVWGKDDQLFGKLQIGDGENK